ncbi:MAG: diadenylate cyclase CdaA [Lentisphaeria bacterium]|nr:diadenylate cyclase CdaA [Lentisphaeria bacterium]
MDELSQIFDLTWDAVKVILQLSLLTIVIYVGLVLLKGSRALIIMTGIMTSWFVVWLLANALELDVFIWILGQIPQILAFVILIIFQPELRKLFATIGSNPHRLFKEQYNPVDLVDQLVDASFSLGERKIGGLLVIERDIPLRSLEESGVKVNAPVSKELLGTIFFKDTPLHDGAVLIRAGVIVAASCFISNLTNNPLDSQLGTRHRAGVGVTEDSDAVCLIISEETGYVSLVASGTLVRNVDRKRLRRHLKNYLMKKEEKKAKVKTKNTNSFSHRVEELKEKVLNNTKSSNTPDEEDLNS